MKGLKNVGRNGRTAFKKDSPFLEFGGAVTEKGTVVFEDFSGVDLFAQGNLRNFSARKAFPPGSQSGRHGRVAGAAGLAGGDSKFWILT